MPSLIPGYEYDIFISYRQKDNKHDGWVTEFVNNLKGELESTFKEEVNVYFDINPHDGLLETHDVDASLKEKLRCVVFIPVLSRTYCDPGAFAWEHELKAFADIASHDQYGLKIRLPNGNVASRIMPVRIHDLDDDDIKLYESVTEGVLRGIEFIYSTSGVNRPLHSKEDSPNDNLNKTFYRDQINKVALAIKEIITGLRKHDNLSVQTLKETPGISNASRKSFKRIIIPGIVTILVLIILGIYFVPRFAEPDVGAEKSIAVLPFEILSSDEDKSWFNEGITDIIINQLSKIADLRVLGRTSTLKYRQEQKSISEIGKELGVNYIIEGTVQRQDDKMRISVQLIRVRNEGHVWSDIYDREWKDIFDIQSDIASKIALELKTVLTPEEKAALNEGGTKNSDAYNLYLQGRYFWSKRTEEGLKKSTEYFEKSLAEDPDYELAYAGLADAYFIRAYWKWVPWEEGIKKAKELALKALDINKDLAEAHTVLGALLNYDERKWEEARKEFQLAIKFNPNYVTAYHYYSELLSILRENQEARKQLNLALSIDPFLPVLHALSSGYYYYENKFTESLEECRILKEIDPEYGNRSALWREFNIHAKLKEDLKAVDALKEALGNDTLNAKLVRHIYDTSGIRGLRKWLIALELKKSKPSTLFIAGEFSRLDMKEEALYWFEKTFENPPPGFALINNNPDYDNIRSDPRFQSIIKRMGLSEYQKQK